MGGRLVLAGNWDRQSPDDWAEQVRPAVAFAMGMITELEESGADLAALRLVRLDDPDVATVGVPFGITAGQGDGARPAGGLTPGRHDRTPQARVRLVLAAVQAARPGAIRALQIDDVDLDSRRLRLAGTGRPMGELTLRVLREWPEYRERR